MSQDDHELDAGLELALRDEDLASVREEWADLWQEIRGGR